MFQVSRWLNLYWFVLLPTVSLLATAFHYRNQSRLWQHNLVSTRTLRWLLIALVTSQVYLGLLVLSSFYESALWPSGGALLSALIVAVTLYRASINVNSDPLHISQKIQHDFHQMDEAATIQRDRRFAQTVLRISPFILATMICVYVLSQQSLRWPGLWLIMLALISPLLITSQPRKRLWLVPLLLVLIALAFGWQSVKLRGALPPGRWTTPMTSASCSSTVQLDLNREHAWCANESTGQIFQFTPDTGLVGQKFVVEYGAQAFAGNANQVWIMQNPASGLIMADKNQQTQVRVNFPIQGTVDPEGRLWVIDVVGILWVNEPGEDWKWLKSSDGLLDNTANVVKTSPDGSVWIGSYHGVSILLPGKSTWQYVTRSDGLPGEVLDFAFAPDGAVWYLWKALSAYQDRSQWGVSSEQGYYWRHIGLGEKTGLDLPISQHALAVDGQGRIWFVAPSYKESTNYLGILVSHNGIVSLYPLGPFDLTPGGILTAGFQGVIDDGDGGIFVYDPVFAPLRHWRPDQKYHEYNPCPQPCMNA